MPYTTSSLMQKLSLVYSSTSRHDIHSFSSPLFINNISPYSKSAFCMSCECNIIFIMPLIPLPLILNLISTVPNTKELQKNKTQKVGFYLMIYLPCIIPTYTAYQKYVPWVMPKLFKNVVLWAPQATGVILKNSCLCIGKKLFNFCNICRP